jgi:hypothetical protein
MPAAEAFVPAAATENAMAPMTSMERTIALAKTIFIVITSPFAAPRE